MRIQFKSLEHTALGVSQRVNHNTSELSCTSWIVYQLNSESWQAAEKPFQDMKTAKFGVRRLDAAFGFVCF
jgi:hypothetical protein